MTSLLPPNATDIELAIEESITRASDLPVKLRALHRPDSCPNNLLPWLAWQRSVDTWNNDWADGVKRQQIKSAYRVHQLKGTAAAVKAAVQAFGSSLVIREWWQKNPVGAPYTFELVLTMGANVPNTAEYQQQIIDSVNRAKPLRAQFTLTTGLSAAGGVALHGIIRPAVYRRLDFKEA